VLIHVTPANENKKASLVTRDERNNAKMNEKSESNANQVAKKDEL
jgi:hypothetical protein